MRDCKFCQRFWEFVYTYSLLITALTFAALALGLCAVTMP